jgi:hypothetical protein
MADQATLNGGQRVRINSPLADGVIGNLAELGGDIATLAELQTKLAVVDMKQAAGAATIPVVLIGGGLVMLLAAVPVAMIGASELLADALALTHRGWAYLIVSAIAMALTVLLVLIGLPRFTRSFDSLVHSKEELARNVAWVKTVLANSGRLPAHRRR